MSRKVSKATHDQLVETFGEKVGTAGANLANKKIREEGDTVQIFDNEQERERTVNRDVKQSMQALGTGSAPTKTVVMRYPPGAYERIFGKGVASGHNN